MVGFAGLLGVLVDLLNNLRLSVDSMPDTVAWMCIAWQRGEGCLHDRVDISRGRQ